MRTYLLTIADDPVHKIVRFQRKSRLVKPLLDKHQVAAAKIGASVIGRQNRGSA